MQIVTTNLVAASKMHEKDYKNNLVNIDLSNSKSRGKGRIPKANDKQGSTILFTGQYVEGDVRIRRAIFRKFVKLFKCNKFHKKYTINGRHFKDALLQYTQLDYF